MTILHPGQELNDRRGRDSNDRRIMAVAVMVALALRRLPKELARRVLTYVRAGNVSYASLDAAQREIRVDAADILFHFDETFEDVDVLMALHDRCRIVVRATFENHGTFRHRRTVWLQEVDDDLLAAFLDGIPASRVILEYDAPGRVAGARLPDKPDRAR